MFTLKRGFTRESMQRAIRAGNTGDRAWTRDVGCQYQTAEGNRCAVGCFIPDGHPALRRPCLGGADDLLWQFPELTGHMPLDVAGLLELQQVHDSAGETDDLRDLLCDWIDTHVKDATCPA